MSDSSNNLEIVANNLAVAVETKNISMWSMVSSSDLVVQTVILLLVIASIWSWAIIVYKLFQLYSVQKKMMGFESFFWSGQSLDQLYEAAKRNINNPLSLIFVSAIEEYKRGYKKVGDVEALKANHKARIVQVMDIFRNRVLEKLESHLSFLATVSSYSPFVGLFGTVWGIMHSFQSIAASKNTSLDVVAPGIAEALLVTAIGLLTAICACVFYNYLSVNVNKINNKIDDFISELENIISRTMDEN